MDQDLGIWAWWAMNVGGNAGDIIDGDVGEEGHNVIVGKANRQTDHSNKVNIDLSDHHTPHRSLEDRVMDIERLLYGEPRFADLGIIRRQKRIQVMGLIHIGISLLMLVLILTTLVGR